MTGYRELALALKQEWVPAARLPTHAELQARFDCSQVTVQRATSLLREQGFVRTIPKVGSYYVSRPPHRNRVAVLFPGHPEAIMRNWRWSRLFAALQASIRSLAQEFPYELVSYFDVDPERPGGPAEERLAAELEERLLAGLILPFTPYMMKEAAWLRDASVPVIAAGAVDFMELGVVRLDHGHFIRRSLEYLREQGRQRVGVIMPTQRLPAYFEPFTREFGIPARPHWFQGVDPFQPEWLQHSLEMMVGASVADQPDALLITDDHLVGATMNALGKLGVKVPDELLVVGHWNFPLPYGGELPVELVGFDAREWLRSAIVDMEARRDGRANRQPTMVPARFVLELAEPMLPTDVGAGLEETQTGLAVCVPGLRE